VEVGDSVFFRVGYKKKILLSMEKSEETFEAVPKLKHKLRRGEIWKGVIVSLSDNPRVYSLKPIRKISKEEFLKMSTKKGEYHL
jgi:hypothetical protein